MVEKLTRDAFKRWSCSRVAGLFGVLTLMLAGSVPDRCGAIEALPLRLQAGPDMVHPVGFGRRGPGARRHRIMQHGARENDGGRPGPDRNGREHDAHDDRPDGQGRGPASDGTPKSGPGGGRGGRGDDVPRDSGDHRPPATPEGPRQAGNTPMICIGGRVRADRCECAGASRQLRGSIHACGDRSVPVLIPVLGGLGGSIQPPQGAVPPPSNGPAVAPPVAGAASSEPFVPDEVLVSVDRATPDGVDDLVARSHGLDVIERTALDHLNRRLLRLRIPDGRTPAAVAAELQGDTRISAPQVNYYYRQQQSETASSLGLQYALVKLDVPRAESLAHGNGALIAVLDSGIDQTHPDLAGSVADVFMPSASPAIGDFHGTEISGILCAHGMVRGIAPDAKLLDVRVFQPQRSDRPSVATTFDLLRGIDWALAKHARVLNMSFAGPSDPLLQRSVGVAAAGGAIIVAAAGNGGAKAPFAYPAAYPEVIAVTATDVADRLYALANHGRYIAIAAPGVDVLVSSGDHAHQLVSGTSYAAAYVSGIIALMLERNPALGAGAARLALTTAALDLGPPGPDDLFGAGRVNAFASLQAVMAP